MPNGSIKHVHLVAQARRDQEGRLEYIGAAQDVTEQKAAEHDLNLARTELAHAERVMTLGALTASIAHEVNQPLAGIVTNSGTCLRMLGADPPNVEGARETARRTIRDGNRAADVITRLRALFGKTAAVAETVDLNEATRGVLALMFSDFLRNQVVLRVELDDEPLLVTGDRVQLQQVLLNLVMNAIDAMKSVSDRARVLRIETMRHEERAALVAIQDSGVGLDAGQMQKLFDPFYTTKPQGLGMGLSICRTILERHGGRLWPETNEGSGATFKFSLPFGDGGRT